MNLVGNIHDLGGFHLIFFCVKHFCCSFIEKVTWFDLHWLCITFFLLETAIQWRITQIWELPLKKHLLKLQKLLMLSLQCYHLLLMWVVTGFPPLHLEGVYFITWIVYLFMLRLWHACFMLWLYWLLLHLSWNFMFHDRSIYFLVCTWQSYLDFWRTYAEESIVLS